MPNMDHAEAIRIKAAEQYLLGELTGELREAFEEHYFSCPGCAADVRAVTSFASAARDVLQQELPVVAPARGSAEAGVGWLAWLRPAVVAPAFAVLIAFVAYQNVVTIPGLRNSSARVTAPQALRSLSLIAGNTRGGGVPTLSVAPGQAFSLFVDIPPSEHFTTYICEVQSEAGAAEVSIPVSGAEAKETVQLLIPGGRLRAGNYTLVVREGSGQGGAESIVARYSFVLAFTR